MFASRNRGALSLGAVLAALAAAACGGSGEPTGTNPGTTPAAVAIVSGNGQVGLVGTTLSLPLSVKVSTSAGVALTGATVNFAVASGAATLAPTSATTDATGVAKTVVTLGSSAGNVQVNATVSGTSLVAAFVVTAGASTIATACSAGSPQSLVAGAVVPGVSGTGICLSGGATGADFALVVFNSNPDSLLATMAVTVKSTGATALATPATAPAFDATPATPGFSAFRNSPSGLRNRFDAQLRETAQRELTPLIPAARTAFRTRAARSAIPSSLTIGQTITLNANGLRACDQLINVRARVAAISNTAIIVADSLNPSSANGGFTDAEYASFATTFDTLVNPLDVSNFGQPTDIDGNGKIVILFTKEVNKLTPRGSGGFIGGFFFERDLFPITTTTTLQGCAGSNFGEMFYLLVPDTLAVFADKRKKADVLGNTIGTLAHEYQHLINAGRRLYVNNADFFETVWLNEGLSHIAEELIYYKAAKLAPRQNISANLFVGDTVAVNRFNEFQSDNFGRYDVFISKPSKTNVYADNDSLETRGATWNLLRYLADHRGSSDGDAWTSLVNTTATGQQNLKNVFGAALTTSIRDWATSVFSDDVAGVIDARFLESSWNMRSIFPKLTGTNNSFPLSVVPLSDASAANLSVVAGGAAYVRFTVPAGTQASVDWSSSGLPVSALMQFSVVRSR